VVDEAVLYVNRPKPSLLHVLLTRCTSNPMKDVQVDNDNFPDIYGDCYISGTYRITTVTRFLLLLTRLSTGFMEGGELHGIVSVKVLDASNTKEVEQV